MGQHIPVVAIIGRPNTGKSTLFNRLYGEQKAIVHDLPGMTRDRHYGRCDYRNRPFNLIDTGGYEDKANTPMLALMREQTLLAVEEADRIIFLTDWTQADDPTNFEIISRLRTSGKPFFLAVNKTEGERRAIQALSDFAIYGVDAVYPVAALHGDGILDLMDAVTEGFEEAEEEDGTRGPVKVAIVGRQNVGKSTLTNRLLGENRMIASPEAGTTRDAIDTDLTVNGEPFTLIDTAGIRRRGHVKKGPELLSVFSSFAAIERCEVAVLVVDATTGVHAQDMHIAGHILEARRGCVIVVNKWDAVKKDNTTYGEFIKNVRREFNFLPHAPILTISAATGQRSFQLWDLIRRVSSQFRGEFGTAELNTTLKRATSYVSPPTRKGRELTLKYVTQTGSAPPVLTLFVNDPALVHFSYERYLQNQFRAQLGLDASPLFLRFKRKSPPRGWEKHQRVIESQDEPGTSRMVQVDEDYTAGDFIEIGNDDE